MHYVRATCVCVCDMIEGTDIFIVFDKKAMLLAVSLAAYLFSFNCCFQRHKMTVMRTLRVALSVITG